MNKLAPTLQAAMANIFDGAIIAVGGFGSSGNPYSLVDAVTAQGAKRLTAACNTITQVWPWVKNGQVARVISGFTSYPGRPEVSSVIQGQIASGTLILETVPHGVLEERLRCGGMGIGAFYTEIGVGTAMEHGKEKRTINGRQHILETALRPDFALVKAWKADRWGNAVCRLAAGNRNITMAMSARTTIVEAEEIVELGQLDPNRIDIPGAFVTTVVQAPRVVRWGKRSSTRTVAAQTGVEDGRLGLTRELIAMRAASELKDGMYVNLGFGLPTAISNYLPPGMEIVLHSEQGILGYGPVVQNEDAWDQDLVNASGEPVTLLPGAAFFDLATSLGMVRGGRIDVTILGAYQVSQHGDLANWQLPNATGGAIGGAMELAFGARRLIVAMEHTDSKGRPKILRQCSYPLTAGAVVDRIITNLAVIDVTPQGLVLAEVAPGVTPEQVQQHTEPTLSLSPSLKVMEL